MSDRYRLLPPCDGVQRLLSPSNQLSKSCSRRSRPASKRVRKARLFSLDHLRNAIGALDQLRIRILHQVANREHHLKQERFLLPQQSSMPNRAANDLAQHVAAAFIRRQHAIGDEER